VLALARAFPDAPIYTSLYEPSLTFPEFGSYDVRTLGLDRIGLLRRHHTLGLPLLAPSFSRLHVDADVVLASSSGWAHGASTNGKKVVFCHTPARWLYQPEQYLRESGAATRAALALLAPSLRRWDARAAASADLYLANSTIVRDRIRGTYGIDAQVVPPPHGVDASGAQEAIGSVEPGFFLAVTRLKPYKNVDAVVDAFGKLDERLVVVGTGPDRDRLLERAGATVSLLGEVTDAQLRWLYANCRGLVAASYEDYGLTPLEVAAFGKPAAVLRWGGFLDTVRDGVTGVYFDEPASVGIARAVTEVVGRQWDEKVIRDHAERYSEASFVGRIRMAIESVLAETGRR
jgi:glycosyltransferase involved in cell wall biosynthesis